jgi:hypothetical protein
VALGVDKNIRPLTRRPGVVAPLLLALVGLLLIRRALPLWDVARRRRRREVTPDRREPAAPQVGRAIPLAVEEPSPKEEAHERAARLTRRTEQVLRASTDAPMRSLSRAGAVVLLGLGVWMLVGQWVLSLPLTSSASSTGTRDEGFAVLLSLAALRLLVAGRSAVATGIVVVCGVLLVCSGSFLDHSAPRAAVNEVVCGGMALLCGVATLDRRRAATRAAGDHGVVTGSV